MNNKLCLTHPNEEFKFICIASHECERRFCAECSYHHSQKYNDANCLPNNIFLSKVLERFSKFHKNEQLPSTILDLKSLISYHQLQFPSILEKIQTSFSTLQKDAQKLTSVLENLMDQVQRSGLSELSVNNLKEIINEINNYTLEQNWKLQSKISKLLLKVINLIDDVLKKCLKIIEKFSSQQAYKIIEYEHNQYSMIGQKLFGLNHGNFTIQQSSTQNRIDYGGEYLFNLKNGLWKELDGCIGTYKMGKKCGKWAILSNEVQIGEGDYDELGNKIGQWKIPLKQQNKYVQNMFWTGIFKNNKRFQEWKLMCNNQTIGIGEFNELGEKIGQWKDVNDEKYTCNSQLVWHGEYRAGIRVRKWNILYRDSDLEEFKIIGGGQYSDLGQKIGWWKDISEEFYQRRSQIIQEGEYKNGIRIGKWNIHYRRPYKNKFKIIGGGNYNDKGFKNDYWREINESSFTSESQIIWEGQYYNGVKIGYWSILYREPNQQQFIQIGGGTFNNQGVKVKQWKDIDQENFNWSSQLLWEGEHKNGLRVGNWFILYRENSQENFLKIGGGFYNEQGNKTGKWIDIYQNKFSWYSQLVFEGEYYEGRKIGKWDIRFRENNRGGGGSFGDFGEKIGIWKDINEKIYSSDRQIIWEGKYENSLRVGLWQILFRKPNVENFEIIGGGQFDNEGKNQGDWVEIDEDQYKNINQVIQTGKYQNGKKIGKWSVQQRDSFTQDFSKISYFIFDERGQMLNSEQINK